MISTYSGPLTRRRCRSKAQAGADALPWSTRQLCSTGLDGKLLRPGESKGVGVLGAVGTCTGPAARFRASMHSAFGVCVASQHRSTARPRFPAECPPAATELTLSDGHWWPRHGCKLYFASAHGSAGHGVSGDPQLVCCWSFPGPVQRCYTALLKAKKARGGICRPSSFAAA